MLVSYIEKKRVKIKGSSLTILVASWLFFFSAYIKLCIYAWNTLLGNLTLLNSSLLYDYMSKSCVFCQISFSPILQCTKLFYLERKENSQSRNKISFPFDDTQFHFDKKHTCFWALLQSLISFLCDQFWIVFRNYYYLGFILLTFYSDEYQMNV